MTPTLRSTFIAASLVLVLGSGCATIESVDEVYRNGGNGPLIMSGTRFDLEATHDPERARRRFGIEGPWLPWADLPASFLLDLTLLPMLVWYEAVR